MKVNKKKSGIIFHKMRRTCKNDKLFEGYPIVSKYKYLGIWIDETLMFDEQIQYLD